MPSPWIAAGILAAAVWLGATTGWADLPPDRLSDHVYIVLPGDSLQRVAQRLRVPAREVAARNGLQPPYTLRPGRRLRLPVMVPREVFRTLPRRDGTSNTAPSTATPGTRRNTAVPPATVPHRTGMVTLVRARDGSSLTTNFNANAPNLRLRVERILRSRSGTEHAMHPRLLRHLATIADRFDGRRIVVLSGYRPHVGGDLSLRTHHAMGSAVDLRVEGVSARDLFEFCTSLGRVGCGFYPAADYVHLDIRATPRSWTVARRTGSNGDPNEPPEDDVSTVLADAAHARTDRRGH